MIMDAFSPFVFNQRQTFQIAVLILLISGCSSQKITPGSHESLNATLWAQTAAEYSAGTRQAYRIASENLNLALLDSQWSAALEQSTDYSNLPPAVILDIDQTVLDNSRYNARIITEYGAYSPETFFQWCEEIAATAIPGARDFIDHAVEQGVIIIYYSRRLESMRDCTTKNLKALGFALPDQKYLLLNSRLPATKKTQLRTDLASRFRILLLVGDDLDDFVAGAKIDSDARKILSSGHADRWGKQWIILPNPMYGGWEASLYEFDYALPRDTQLNLKRQNLEE